MIINDEESYFCNKKCEVVLSKYRVKHRVVIAYHCQTSRQVEVSNRKIVNASRKNWSRQLHDMFAHIKQHMKLPWECHLTS